MLHICNCGPKKVKVNKEGGNRLGLITSSICDRSVDSRDKKRGEKISIGWSSEDETLEELTSHFDPSQCRVGDCTSEVTCHWCSKKKIFAIVNEQKVFLTKTVL